MKKTLSLFFATLVMATSFAATAVINFSGKSSDGTSCILDKVQVENLTQGWSESISDVSLTIEVLDKNEAIDAVSADNDFLVSDNTYEGHAQVVFNMLQAGPVYVNVFDITGRCVCQSITEQDAGCHTVNMEFNTPQMYYFQISIPGKKFSHSFMNMRSGGNMKIQYISETATHKIPAIESAGHTCRVGDEMRYTGYTTHNGIQYSNVQKQTIKKENMTVTFVFDIPADEAAYYIKHSWGSGADADWTWQPMKEESEGRYTYTGEWGGIGANINNVAKDDGALWFPESSIPGSAYLGIGETVTFVYTPSTSTLTIGDALEAPTGFTLSQTSTYVELSWDKVKGAYGYIIFRALEEDEYYNYLDQTTSTTYYDYSVSSGETYYYAVAAFDSYDEMGDIVEDYITFKGGSTSSKPSTPTGLEAGGSSSCIVLMWNSVSGATRYNVYRATSASGSYSYKGYTANTYYEDCTVSAGTTYYYKVSAENSSGESDKSSYVSAKITSGGGSTKLDAPTGVTATASTYSITVKWNSVSSATKYNVYRSTSSNSSYSQVSTEYGTSYVDSNVKSGTTYYYKVAAVASDGTVGTPSTYVSAKIDGGSSSTLSAPTNVKATYISGSHYVQVTWNEVALCDSYEIYRSTSESSNGSKIGNASNSDGGVYVDKLSSSVDKTWYYYRVKAKSSYLGKTSDYSEVARVYIDKNPVAPCPASNLKISGSSSLTISWSVQTQSGCGTPTEKYIQFYDYSSSASNKWVDEKVTSNSYTLTSAKLKQYTNGGSTLAGCITFYNANGKSCLHFEYNTSTKNVTILSTNCY